MGLKDWLPPILSRKSSGVTPLIVRMFNGQPVWSETDFSNLAKEGFQNNVWVYRCVMAIAQAAAGVDWLLYQKSSTGKQMEEIEKHPLLDLINRPNEFQSKQEFIETAIAFLNLSGNSYLEMVGPNAGPPKELYSLRPDRIQVIPDYKNYVGGYRYTVNGFNKDYKSNELMHMKFFSALDDYYGLSPISVAARGIDNDNAANAWNTGVLQNGARPSGAMVTEQTLTDIQYGRLKGQIDTQYKGSVNARKPMLLEGGLKWQEMGLSPVDMDFINSKKLSRLEICAAFGVPPELVGDKEHATYSNYQEARQSFYMETVLPQLDKLKDKLNSILVPLFGDGLYLDYDRDNIEALQENREQLWGTILEAVKSGMLTVNEGRQAMGYEQATGGNVRLIPNTLYAVGDDKGEYNPPVPANQKPVDNGGTSGKKSFDLYTAEEKTAHWKAVDGRRDNYYDTVSQQIKKRFTAEQKAVVEAYKKRGSILSVYASIDSQAKKWDTLFSAIYVMVMQDFGESTYSSLKSQADDMEIKMETKGLFDVFAAAVQSFIKNTVAQKVVQVTDTTKKAIKGIVDVGTQNGESIDQIAARIDDLYMNQIIPNRSVVIARTEVISASNAGSQKAAEQTGLNYNREWLSTRDERTRDGHAEVNGQTVAKEDPFIVPFDGHDEKLMFPADSSLGASAGNVIQCRCTEIYNVIK